MTGKKILGADYIYIWAEKTGGNNQSGNKGNTVDNHNSGDTRNGIFTFLFIWQYKKIYCLAGNS